MKESKILLTGSIITIIFALCAMFFLINKMLSSSSNIVKEANENQINEIETSNNIDTTDNKAIIINNITQNTISENSNGVIQNEEANQLVQNNIENEARNENVSTKQNVLTKGSGTYDMLDTRNRDEEDLNEINKFYDFLHENYPNVLATIDKVEKIIIDKNNQFIYCNDIDGFELMFQINGDNYIRLTTDQFNQVKNYVSNNGIK